MQVVIVIESERLTGCKLEIGGWAWQNGKTAGTCVQAQRTRSAVGSPVARRLLRGRHDRAVIGTNDVQRSINRPSLGRDQDRELQGHQTGLQHQAQYREPGNHRFEHPARSNNLALSD